MSEEKFDKSIYEEAAKAVLDAAKRRSYYFSYRPLAECKSVASAKQQCSRSRQIICSA